MGTYVVVAKVDQIVTREVQLEVLASSLEQAQDKAREALGEYPKPVTVEGIKRMVTNKANYWIPRNIEFVTTEEEKTAA